MKSILTGALSLVLLISFESASFAAHKTHKHRRHHQNYYYTYPSGITERQLRNERAYQRGEYYEHDSNALIPGSRAWWEQKERESGGDNRR
jgi:hypothetical protein